MKPLSGTYYRLIETGRAGEILAPARSPEGRFHHGQQPALYMSETIEGTHVAMARYNGANGPEQTAHAVLVKEANVVDLRDLRQCDRLSIDPKMMNLVWQDLPRPSLTWIISDGARAAGADGMLYPSRSRPELTHLVLFQWNLPVGPILTVKSSP